MKNHNNPILTLLMFFLCAQTSPSQASSIDNEFYGVATPKNLVKIDNELFNPFDGLSSNCTFLKDLQKRRQSFAIAICVVKGGASEVLTRISFRRSGTTIVRTGSMDSQPVAVEERNGYLRISAAASCGITDDAGFHAAKGLCYSAAAFGENYIVTVETDGTEPLDTVRKIVDSLVIKNPGNIQSTRVLLEKIDLNI